MPCLLVFLTTNLSELPVDLLEGSESVCSNTVVAKRGKRDKTQKKQACLKTTYHCVRKYNKRLDNNMYTKRSL